MAVGGKSDRLTELDVIIVGAGPGGASCAVACAQRGLRVALLDRCAQPLERPGESLHPGIEPLLDHLGAGAALRAAGFPRHPGHRLRHNGAITFVPFGNDDTGPWLGFQARRSALDQILLQRARQLGVDVRRPWTGGRPVVSQGRVVGVENSDSRLEARIVVDASGGRHWMARHLGLDIVTHSPRLTARYGYARGNYAPCEDAPLFTTEPWGWSWVARVDPSLYAWVMLPLTLSPPGGPPGQLHGLIGTGRARTADVTWRSVTPAAGPGYVLVGDAAAVLDPASSHGVLRAVLSGIRAAEVVAARADFPVAASAEAYRAWMDAWLSHDLNAMRRLYVEMPARPLWAARPAEQ